MSKILRSFGKYVERHEILTSAVILLIAAILAGGLAYSLWMDAETFVSPFALERPDGANLSEALTAHSAAGEFLNLRYGVTVAVISAILGGAVALLLTYFAMKAARRQGDVALLEFVESRSGSLREVQPQLVRSFSNIILAGNQLRSVLPQAKVDLAKAFPEGGSDEQINEFVQSHENAKDFKRHFNELITALVDMREAFNQLSKNHYVRAFSQRKIINSTKENNPFLFFRAKAPMFLDHVYENFAHDLDELIDHVADFADKTEPFEVFRAKEACLESESTLEFVGSILFSPKTETRSQAGNKTIRVWRNYGAAELLWLYRLLAVNETELISVYRSVFTTRAGTLQDYLEALPIYSGASTEWHDAVEFQFLHFERLIVLEISDGKTSVRRPFQEGDEKLIEPKKAI